MKKWLLFQSISLAVMAAVLMTVGQGLMPQSLIAANQPPPLQDDIQVLASGPIHEAFAEAVVFDPEPGIVTAKQPPPDIEEIPPSQKPEGDVEWIPGYWAWDDERGDYIWISGIWRVPPPGRQWVPGYWNPVRNGHQWVSGYWAIDSEGSAEYLPEPPATVEVGPSSRAPSSDFIWIPGCWVWHYGRYAWRPGYWSRVNPDWVWVPAHYIWTPRGYIYSSGYWDYTIVRRGILFAPVILPPRVFIGFHFVFTPGFVIHVSVFDDALFLRPRYRHYYYGDYYAAHYYHMGIYPWFSLHSRRVAYDPIYVRQRWHHRHDYSWERRLETTFQERRNREELRPPRRYVQHTQSKRKIGSSTAARFDYVRSVEHADRKGFEIYRFRKLSEEERRGYTGREKEVHEYKKTRQTLEQILPEKRTNRPDKPDKTKITRSPIRARSTQHLERKKAPPARHDEPKPNRNIEPLKKRASTSRQTDKTHVREDAHHTDKSHVREDDRHKHDGRR